VRAKRSTIYPYSLEIEVINMAVFRIIASRPQVIKDYDHHPEFDVEIIEGDLNQDDRFILWETRHPFPVIIRKIAKGEVTTLSVSCSVSYEGWHVGTVVDTNNPDAGRKYGYRTRDAKQLYHPEVLRKYEGSDEYPKYTTFKIIF
jgi:hypothetical protein